MERSSVFDLQLSKCHMTAGVFTGGGSVQYNTGIVIDMSLSSKHSEEFHFKVTHLCFSVHVESVWI